MSRRKQFLCELQEELRKIETEKTNAANAHALATARHWLYNGIDAAKKMCNDHCEMDGKRCHDECLLVKEIAKAIAGIKD